jgi:hypothetical protein
MDEGALPETHWVEDFDAQGEHQVRLALSSGGYNRGMRLAATAWLKRKSQERLAIEAAVQGERAAHAGKAFGRKRLATLAVLVFASAVALGAVDLLVGWLTRLSLGQT